MRSRARARQPVGVGDVGVERRPDHVDARAHAARPAAAVAARRGVADSWKPADAIAEDEDEQQQLGAARTPARWPTRRPCGSGRTRRRRRSPRAPAPRPTAGRGRERRGDALRHLRVGDQHLPAQREQRVQPRRRVLLGAGEQPLRRRASRRARTTCSSSSRRPSRSDMRGGERGVVARAVDLLEQRVHQRPELDHLAVGAAHERRAVLVAGAADSPSSSRPSARREGAAGRRPARGGPVAVALMPARRRPLLLVDRRRPARRWRWPPRRRGAG